MANSLKLTDFDYSLPKELIAQYPVERRDSSRLLVLNRETGTMEHKRFSDIVGYFVPGDVLVLNDTKVIPARLIGRTQSGGKVEILLLRNADGRSALWYALANPGRKLKQGAQISFANGKLSCRVMDTQNEQKLLQFSENACLPARQGRLMEIIDKIGQVPLPPYIKRNPEITDTTRYQTVYAKKQGAVAAPTAGLHFTQELLNQIKAKGVKIAYLTLHVGYGTFKPVKCDEIKHHEMDKESFELSQDSARILGDTKKKGGRIFAVGTTTTRVLETITSLVPSSGYTNLFIYPGYKFRFTDCLLTNFHLPKTTLLMLSAAFAGHELIMRAYREAIEQGYRFYSYGDTMLVI
ncbi:MAG: tRNA preQ1(34) S-adenosylmethionine ribosyltransferase-isomerase QueA [Candidatus Omnitrophota bacterium]